MNSVKNKSMKIPKNTKNRTPIPHENNTKREKLKDVFSDRRIYFVITSSLDGIVEQLKITLET